MNASAPARAAPAWSRRAAGARRRAGGPGARSGVRRPGVLSTASAISSYPKSKTSRSTNTARSVGRERLQHGEHRDRDAVGELDVLGHVRAWSAAARAATGRRRSSRRRALRAHPVQRLPGDDPDQVRALVAHLGAVHADPPQPRLLQHVLGVGGRAEHLVGDGEQQFGCRTKTSVDSAFMEAPCVVGVHGDTGPTDICGRGFQVEIVTNRLRGALDPGRVRRLAAAPGRVRGGAGVPGRPRHRRARRQAGTRHVLLREGGPLLGYARVLDDTDAWRIGRVVLAKEGRGRGHRGPPDERSARY